MAGFESGMGEEESCLSGTVGFIGIENGKHSKRETGLTGTPQMEAIFSRGTLVHTPLCGKMTRKTT